MDVRGALARFIPGLGSGRADPASEIFATMHSSDLTIHLDGVCQAPTRKPPWTDGVWDRHEQARRTEPSRFALTLLDLHPAFIDSHEETPHWMLVVQAEALAMEWTAASFGQHEAGEWLLGHPGIRPQDARILADAGLGPFDPIDLRTPVRRVTDNGASAAS